MPLNRLNELIRGKRGVAADTALRLAELLKTDPEIWMSLQSQCDLWHAPLDIARALEERAHLSVATVRGRLLAAGYVVESLASASLGRVLASAASSRSF